ncbi:protein O-GlcNAcase isoform X1 [Eupeodes corollae]|uniref:protein O-GlcNAcase isoform X1 n=1 Tax=Eupeodes corollae TaxID=290404 RepID=UPI002491C199|nr:protein O-GlcNAcase isoform X1 [Eupeodes corollae]
MADVEKATAEKKNSNFICGVIEGFYGRPWTTEQRKDLFRKLKKWGMDSYVYAPKDDYKHRAYWRELYTVEEADHLTSLIAAAKEQGIVFYYALSPGLDMNYSNQKEVQTLKRKLEQVAQFGCEAFALLFDDIESELSKADKEIFQTFGNAQVSVTNEIFSHLNNPKFLFCPTQYCSSRAVPTVTDSEYLNTLGSKLNVDIDIMWTGNKVISKIITLESIQEITEVLRRPPVIWDNLHANDYDQKRVFLGPYSGRSPELIPYLRGVMTNPNCEFHANTIAIHTLAYWSKCSLDNKINSTFSADIKLETENDDGISNEGVPSCLSKNIYHPRVALKNAILEWLPEFSIEKEAWGPITKPQPQVTMVMPIIPIIPSINTCMSLTTTTTTSTNSKTSTVPEVNTNQLQALADVCSTVNSSSVNPISNSVMNSLVSATKVITNDDILNPITTNVATTIEMPKKIPISSVPVPIMHVKNEETKAPIEDVEITNTSTNACEEIEIKTTKTNEIEPVDYPIEDDCLTNEVGTVTNAVAEAAPLANVNDSVEKRDGIETVQMEENNLSPFSGNEPMECSSSLASQTSPKEIGKIVSDDVIMSETVNEFNVTCSANSMQVESSEPSPISNTEMADDEEKVNDQVITVDDLYLLCDLFYLPFEHGSRGSKLLNEFNWLKANAFVLLGVRKKSDPPKPEIIEWEERADKFSALCQAVQNLSNKLSRCANKEICYDLFSYVWDMAGTLMLLNAFIKWLSLAHFPSNVYSYTQGSYTWFSKGWKENFMSGDQEPWVFRGGLTADLQRLMPVDSGNDLFIYKLPDAPTSSYYTIRPYSPIDEPDVNRVCQEVFKASDKILPGNLGESISDNTVGPFITLTPEFCMVALNSFNTIIGYGCAAPDLKTFVRNFEMCWIPSMHEKYPLSLLESTENLDEEIKDIINGFYNFKYDCPQEIIASHPSVMTVGILNEDLAMDGIAKRLVTALLAALRSNGSFGVHVRLSEKETNQIQFYTKLGFTEIHRNVNSGQIYFGRHF